MRASENLPLAARIFLYIAAVPVQLNGCFDPTQEDALNHTAVKTLDDLARFLRRMSDWFVRELYCNTCFIFRLTRAVATPITIPQHVLQRAATPITNHRSE